MGVPYSTARIIAPLAFAYDFAAQQYGIFSTPSMKDIHDANMSFFSPQPYFIAAFFFPQQLFQLAWLYKLWRVDPKNPREKADAEQMVRYVPYYVLGNVCIGTWMFFWNADKLVIADAFVVVNTAAQLWYVFTQLPPMNTRSWPSILTHVVAKSFAGIGVLDILHNTSAAFYKEQTPSTLVKVATGLGFAGLSAASDWIFGGCMVYDLIALSVGQYSRDNGWSQVLGLSAMVCAVIVIVKNRIRPPYVSLRQEYTATAQEDGDERA